MILGLTGVRGSGKDTLADHLVDKYNFKRIAFADPVREKVMFLLQLSSNEEYDRVKRTQLFWERHSDSVRNIDGRHLVREIGMLMLSYDQEQFTNYVTTEISRNIEKFHYVVTDLRMEHEYRSLKRLEAYIVKINTGRENDDSHVTEIGFSDDRCDYIINNFDRNLEDFKTNIDEMIQERFNVYPSGK